MKVFAISDLHFANAVDKPMDVFGGEWENYENKIEANWDKLVSEDDIVLVSGDISWGMNMEQALPDIKQLGAFKGHKVIIKGNHDYWWQSISVVRENLPHKMFAIQNDSIRIGDYLICGTRGWTMPEEGKTLSKEDQKILDREYIRLGLSLEHMQKQRKDTDKVICMMHYPPFNFSRKESDFTKLISKYKVDKVVYGHIHGKKDNRGIKTTIDDIDYFLTSCDQINNTPVLIIEP